MLVPDKLRMSDLEEAVTRYERNLERAGRYLSSRGIPKWAAVAARLGVCSDPVPQHEAMRDRLSIPYLTVAGPSTLKFRCIQHDDCKQEGCIKYLGAEGDEPRLYNVVDLLVPSPVLCVTEGELDCITVSKVCGTPCVAYPGVSAWRPYMTRAISDYEKVIVIADGDKPGRAAAKEIAKRIGGEVILLPDGHDSNSYVNERGPGALLEVLGFKPDYDEEPPF